MRKFILFHFLSILLIFCLASCSLNKDYLLTDTQAGINYTMHKSHSGKFKNCSLCNNPSRTSQPNDSPETPLNNKEEEQIFASNAIAETYLLKPSKFLLDVPVIDISIENKNTESAFIKKKSKRALEKKSETKKNKNDGGMIASFVIILFVLFLVNAGLRFLYALMHMY